MTLVREAEDGNTGSKDTEGTMANIHIKGMFYG